MLDALVSFGGNILTNIFVTLIMGIGGALLTECIALLFKAILYLLFSVVGPCLLFYAEVNSFFTQFTFLGSLADIVKVIAFGLLILIVAYQIIKSIFSYLGFEADEPWKIMIRLLIFGFMAYYALDLCKYLNSIFLNITGSMLNFCNIDAGATWQDFQNSLSSSNFLTETFSGAAFINIILYLYLLVKLIGAQLRFGYRFILLLILDMTAPLAFITGVSKSTKGVLQGWTRLYVGNVSTQILQAFMIFIMMHIQSVDVTMQMRQYSTELVQGFPIDSAAVASMLQLFMVVTVSGVLEKLESLMKEVSLAVGLDAGHIMGLEDLTSQLGEMNYNMSMLVGGGSGGQGGVYDIMRMQRGGR